MLQHQLSIGEDKETIYRFPCEPVDSNMYFIHSGDTGIVFDPNENDELLFLFEKYGTKQIVIVLTHEHYDHTNGATWLQSRINNRLFCQKYCAKVISTERGNSPKLVSLILSLKDAEDGGHRYLDFKSKYRKYILKADETFEEEATIRVDKLELECYHKPGHSPGSAIYLLNKKYVFTGDSLIQNTPTILRFPDSDKNQYEKITRPFLKSLDKNMLVFPGHGEPFKISESKYL